MLILFQDFIRAPHFIWYLNAEVHVLHIHQKAKDGALCVLQQCTRFAMGNPGVRT